MSDRRTRPSIPFWDRIRVSLSLLIYAGLAEYVSPGPFIQARWGRVIYVLLLAAIIYQLHRLRQETSPRYYRRTQRRWKRWQGRSSHLTDYTRYRIYRLFVSAVLLYGVGWMIDGATEKCQGALQCTFYLPILLWQNVGFIVQVLLTLVMSFMGIFLLMFMMARTDLAQVIMPDTIRRRFSDVYGQDRAVARVRENLDFLNRPDLIESRGGQIPGGILLYGPPGTGKSLIAEAFAGETGKPFVNVGPGAFSNMFVGVPILKVKMLFRLLRKLALRHGGVIAFLDEIDSLGSRGADVSGGGMIGRAVEAVNVVPGGGGNVNSQGALEVFLSEMSGLRTPRGLLNKLRKIIGLQPSPPPKYRIMFIGATNRIGALDDALVRPGRFDRHIRVPIPNLEGRYQTLIGYLGKVAHSLTDEQIRTVARDNPEATGAWVEVIVNEGLIRAIRAGRETVTAEDLRESVRWKRIGEDEGRQTHEEDQRRVEIHEAAHAVAVHHFVPGNFIESASVVRRGGALGVVRHLSRDERFTHTRSELLGAMKVSLASHVIESMFYAGDVGTGPHGDLANATDLAWKMVERYAMAEPLPTRREGEKSSPRAQGLVEGLYQRAYEETWEFLSARRDQIVAVADLLAVENTVDGLVIHGLLRRMEAEREATP